jgi:hypothetical protein
MRSQLRPEVLLGVVVLGLLGLGVGVFAMNRSPGTTDDTAAIAARIAAKRAADKKAAPPKKHTAPAHKKASTGSLVRIRHALENHSVVVVLFYEPRASYDGIQTREARAGALDADAAFVAVDVSKNRQVAPLARKYGVMDAPSLLLVTRKGVATRIVGFAERATVAQAAENAR